MDGQSKKKRTKTKLNECDLSQANNQELANAIMRTFMSLKFNLDPFLFVSSSVRAAWWHTVASQEEGLWLAPFLGLSVRSLRDLPVLEWVSSGHQNMCIRSIRQSVPLALTKALVKIWSWSPAAHCSSGMVKCEEQVSLYSTLYVINRDLSTSLLMVDYIVVWGCVNFFSF